eukprot:255398_1
MISGIYKHKHNYFYFFGYNNNTKQFGYYYSTNSKLIDLTFISIQNKIQSVTRNLLKHSYYLRYWKHNNWIIIPNNETNSCIDSMIVIMLYEINPNQYLIELEMSSESNSDSDIDSDIDNDCDGLFSVNCVEWFSIETIDEFNGQFSIELDENSNKLLYCSNNNGIAYIQFNDLNYDKLQCKGKKKENVKNNDIELDFLYTDSTENENDS